MSCESAPMRGCQLPQCMVDQRPAYEQRNRRGRRENQVLSRKSGMIRADKRKKHKYL